MSNSEQHAILGHDAQYGAICFFLKQKEAYEMRISDWSSDVCASDLIMTGSVASAAKVTRTKPRGGITDFDLSQVDAGIISEAEINRTYRGRIRAVDYRQHLRGILDLPTNRTDPLERRRQGHTAMDGHATEDRKSTRLNSSH